MKKFLVGIVTLVAAAMLSSPAFGALSNPYPVDGGTFTFWQDVGKTQLSTLEAAIDVSSIQPSNVSTNLPSSWGEEIALFELSEVGWGTSGTFTFSAPVQIVSAKWDGIQYAFLFDDQVRAIAWADLSHGMSNIRGYNAVPVPAAVWLLGSGVLGLVAVRRRRS